MATVPVWIQIFVRELVASRRAWDQVIWGGGQLFCFAGFKEESNLAIDSKGGNP